MGRIALRELAKQGCLQSSGLAHLTCNLIISEEELQGGLMSKGTSKIFGRL